MVGDAPICCSFQPTVSLCRTTLALGCSQAVTGRDRGITTGAFLEGCAVLLSDSFGSRTLHGLDWNFLRAVLQRDFGYPLPTPSFTPSDLSVI